MCRYLLILFVCEYRLLLCNTFDFDSSPAVIQSILDTHLSQMLINVCVSALLQSVMFE